MAMPQTRRSRRPGSSALARLLADSGGQPGASIAIADAALGTEDNLTALRDTFFITRFPATESACGRIIAEPVARNHWEEVGGRAPTQPTKHRPGTCSTVAEGSVTFYGQPYRAVVVHSSSQDQRRQQHLARERHASSATLEATAREAARQEYCCHADAEAAAAQLRALQRAYHGVTGDVEEPPTYGPGRPSATQPRVVKALRDGLHVTRHERSEVMARTRQEAGCFVLLTHGPTVGEMAPRATAVLQAYQEQQGIEQNSGFLQAPLIVKSLLLNQPERIEALGLVFWLALLLWRRVESTLRGHGEPPETPWPGWDKKATQQPTACMMMTKFAAVPVLTGGCQRQLVHPLSPVQQHYLRARGVPAMYFTAPQSGWIPR